ncbi:hypothetical protein DYB38_001121 [Aphanomyces astaci]|uniref:ubiquitinyl hydrolase 1 n=2 Tax=Aphanomyces astaci TaxID=112090 RepID=A0A397DFI2_APHAT|nr:hypothetical protein DYB38_001121 [Aphanomyces astaci]
MTGADLFKIHMHEPKKAAAGSDDASQYVPVGRSKSQAIGAFIEWRETQAVMIALVVLDVAAAVASLVLDLLAQTGVVVPPILGQLLQSFGGFTLILFMIELAVLIWVFQLAFFTHIGYGIDFGVVVSSFSWELSRQSKGLRLLGVFRLWRIFRLVNTFLNDERSQHAATANLLEIEKQVPHVSLPPFPLRFYYGQAVDAAALKLQRLEDALEKEYQAKTTLNLALQEYKDEVDTLKEALTIAAMSVTTSYAEDEGDFESSDDEGRGGLRQARAKRPIVSNRTGSRRKQPPSPSDHIDTSTATSSSSRLHSRLLARGPSSRSTVRESPRATVYPLGNQPNATSSTDSKRPADEANDASMNYDDDGNAKVLLPPTNSVTYPGVQGSSNKEPRRDATPSDKLESITIGTRSFSNSSLQPSIVVAGGSSLSCKGAVGLQNLGNTCFMNSCLQCLNNVHSVMKYFRSNAHLHELNGSSPTAGKLACSVFGDLSQALWSGAEFSSTRPVELKRVVGKLASRFVGYDQHDAQEFLRFLLDGLHEDLNRILKKPAYYEIPDRPHAPERDLSDEYWQYYIQRNASALSEQFCGQLRSEVTCQTCSHRSICFDLPVPKKAKGGAIRFGAFKSTSSNEDTSMCTVHDCLRAYTEEEHMKDEDAFYCAKCKTHRSVVKSICLQRCPNVLVLHLKRFSYSTFSRDKVSTAVKFPTEGLEIKEFCSKDNICNYTLFECRNPENGNWYDFNDETVSALKKPNAASASAYILFYQRKGQSAK